MQYGLLKGKPSLGRSPTGLRISIICKQSGTGVKTINGSFKFLTKLLIKGQKKYKGSIRENALAWNFCLDKNKIQSPRLVTKRSRTKKSLRMHLCNM